MARDDLARERSSLPAVDYIKSAAILAVLVQHAVPVMFDRQWTPKESMVFAIVSFHVPTFLFLAGFLSHVDTAVTWRNVTVRLRRAVLPYLVATAVVWIFGFVDVPTLRRLLFVIVTGSAFGHYYFVPALIFCLLLLPVFSRMTTPLLIGSTLLLIVINAYMWATPEWRLGDLFWQVRNPILQFHLGFFLLGMVSARLRPTLEDLGARYRFVTMTIAGACVVLFGGLGYATDAIFHPAPRTLYMLSVMALVATCVPPRPAPPWVRFLSEATFTIYLYHWFAYLAVMPHTHGASVPLRIAVLMSVGLAFSASIALLGRRALGSRSRTLLGT